MLQVMKMQYRIKNRRIEVDCSDDGNYEDFSENVYISEVKKDLISGKESVLIMLQHENGEDELVELPHQAIGPRIISELATYGFTCVDNKANNNFLQLILLESKKAVVQKRYFHKRLGFVKTKNGSELFLLHNPIGENDALRRSSTYIYDEYSKPRGCLTGWRAAVKNHVYGKGYTELALAIGTVAPIAHILLEENVISEVPLVSVTGSSSSGKTTSLVLGASIWYSKKMIENFNCTKNAFFETMCQSMGVPMFVDEASAVPDWDFTSVLYNLPKGESKRRCLGDGELQERKKFSGAIIFTGERSFFEQTNGNHGLDARLLELTLPWTVDASHADSIAEDFGRHYGVAAVPLMTWILSNKSIIRKKYTVYKESLEEQCRKHITDSVIMRLIKIPAMILTAAYVLNQALRITLDIENIEATLRDVLIAKGEAIKNSPEIWHEQLLNNALDNADKIPYPDDMPNAKKLWGFHGLYKKESIIWIREDIFEKWLKSITPTEFDKARKQLADKELIYYARRHYTESKKLRGVNVDCFGLYLGKPKKSGTRNGNSARKK